MQAAPDLPPWTLHALRKHVIHDGLILRLLPTDATALELNNHLAEDLFHPRG